MCMEKITSRNNAYIKKIVKLSASSGERKKTNQFVLEGVRLCFDIINSDAVLLELFVTQDCYHKNREAVDRLAARSKKAFLIDGDCAARLADTVSPQGLFCVCERIRATAQIHEKGKYIALENIQDPSNLGAILRTAEALGMDGVILSGCTDAFSPKSLRASMGALLRIEMLETDDLCALLTRCRNGGMKILAAVPDRSAADITKIDMHNGVICVIGNEGNGLTEAVKSLSSYLVTIKMSGRAESLNASVAASIAMWEMMRGVGSGD